MRLQLLNHAVIVDAASSAAFLAPAFRACGVPCIHVISRSTLPLAQQKQFYAPDYVSTIVHDGRLGSTLAALRRYDVGVVLQGQDSGLELADTLAERLSLRCRNPLPSSPSRRDKFLMIEGVRRAGLRAPHQFCSASPAEIVSWAKHQLLPLVLKPTRSAGAAGVKVCRSLQQVAAAAESIVSTTSFFNERNEAIVAQSYLEGQEYIADCVSYDGRHKAVGLWLVDRDRTHSPRLEKMMTVDYHQRRYRHLIEYGFKVLDALDMRYGPSQIEMIETPQGPTLVELNARLHGSLDPRLAAAVNGQSHVSATVAAFLNPDHFLRTRHQGAVFSGFCCQVLLHCPRAGVLRRDFVWDSLVRLPSFVSLKRWARLGKAVRVTTNLRTALGMVNLYGTDPQAVLDDWRRIRSLEAEFFARPEVVCEPEDQAPPPEQAACDPPERGAGDRPFMTSS